MNGSFTQAAALLAALAVAGDDAKSQQAAAWIIGGAGMALPMALATAVPSAAVHCVELDAVAIDLAHRFFGVPVAGEAGGIAVQQGDGLALLMDGGLPEDAVSLLAVDIDLLREGGVGPGPVFGPALWRRALRCLRPGGGVVCLNAIGAASEGLQALASLVLGVAKELGVSLVAGCLLPAGGSYERCWSPWRPRPCTLFFGPPAVLRPLETAAGTGGAAAFKDAPAFDRCLGPDRIRRCLKGTMQMAVCFEGECVCDVASCFLAGSCHTLCGKRTDTPCASEDHSACEEQGGRCIAGACECGEGDCLNVDGTCQLALPTTTTTTTVTTTTTTTTASTTTDAPPVVAVPPREGPSTSMVCSRDTGATCAWWSCDQEVTGPSHCWTGRCMCEPGHCMMDGRCVEVGQKCRDTQVHCAQDSECPKSTVCIGGSCFCNVLSCSVGSECKSWRCRWKVAHHCEGCEAHGGVCVAGSCRCAAGMCLNDEGMCADGKERAVTLVKAADGGVLDGSRSTWPWLPLWLSSLLLALLALLAFGSAARWLQSARRTGAREPMLER